MDVMFGLENVLIVCSGGYTMSLLYLTDIIKRVGLDPKEVKLIRHAFSHETFKKYYEITKLKI